MDPVQLILQLEYFTTSSNSTSSCILLNQHLGPGHLPPPNPLLTLLPILQNFSRRTQEKKHLWRKSRKQRDEEQQRRPPPLFLLATNGDRLPVNLHALATTYRHEEDKVERAAPLDFPVTDELERGAFLASRQRRRWASRGPPARALTAVKGAAENTSTPPLTAPRAAALRAAAGASPVDFRRVTDQEKEALRGEDKSSSGEETSRTG